MVETRQKRPTLRTISDLSGLAVTTVSRALNDAPDIGQSTKQKVRQIARDIGYVPDRAAQRLRTGKTNVISLVLGAGDEVTDHSGQLVSSIAKTLRNTRYHMIVTPYFPNEDPMIPVSYIVKTQSADAVILNRVEVDDPRVAYLMERNFPFVTYGRSKWRDAHPYFDFDNAAFGQAAAETLIAAGRRHLALIAPPLDQNYAQDMITGLTAEVPSEDVTFQIVAGCSADDTTDDIQSALTAHLDAHPETDGLVCPGATTAIAATVAIESTGRTIGKEIDLFAKEALQLLRHFRPPIRTVQENVSLAGERLAQAAIQAIEKPEKPPLQHLMKGSVQRR